MPKNRRDFYRVGLHAVYLSLYDHLCELLPIHWQPTCGLRTLAEQTRLYAIGRTTPGLIVTRAMPGKSLHNFGLASDWDFFPKGIYSPLKFEDPRWAEYEQICDQVGVRRIAWEKPHNEYPLAISIDKIYDTFLNDGFTAVSDLLKGEIKHA